MSKARIKVTCSVGYLVSLGTVWFVIGFACGALVIGAM